MELVQAKQLKPGNKVIYKTPDGYNNDISLGAKVTIKRIDVQPRIVGVWLEETSEYFDSRHFELAGFTRKRRGSKSIH